MKVALSFPGCHRRAGVERVMFECAHFLAGNGHDVHVFAREWEPDHSTSIAYHAVASAARPWFRTGPSYFQQASRAIDLDAFDVVNTHGVVCPTGGVQWVQSVHAAWLERAKHHRPLWSLARWKQALNPVHAPLLALERHHFARRDYQKVIATTSDVREDLRRFYNVPNDHVVIVPNGFSPSEFNPVRREERRDVVRLRLGLMPDQVVLLFVGNELERKGFRTLLAAVKILNRRDVRVLVVGRPSRRAIMKLACTHQVEDQVIACGPTADVAEFHAASDLFVLPTQYEAFCLAILEALGSGLPVVTSNVPGARDAIKPSINGLMINEPTSAEELAAALARVLEPDFRHAMSQNASASVSHHQWPIVLRAYENVLRQAAHGRSHAKPCTTGAGKRLAI